MDPAATSVHHRPMGNRGKPFLERHRTGRRPIRFVKVAAGHLRLGYDEDGLLSTVALVADPSEDAPAIGNRLALTLTPDRQEECATFLAEEAVSGVEWRDGSARWGHTYDDDAGPPEGREIALEAWIEECVAEMASPPAEVAADIQRGFDLQGASEAIEAGDEAVRERFWARCSPRTEGEVRQVLALVEKAAREADRDLSFCCVEPLKRARAGEVLVLEGLTSLVERTDPADFERSEFYEVLSRHGAKADAAMAERWSRLARRAFEVLGPEALHAIHAGHLFAALAKVPGRPARDLFRSVVAAVEAASPDVRSDVEGLVFYRAIRSGR
jgi:hypothetical protein